MSEAAPLIMAQSWLWASQIAVKNITAKFLVTVLKRDEVWVLKFFELWNDFDTLSNKQ